MIDSVDAEFVLASAALREELEADGAEADEPVALTTGASPPTREAPPVS